MYLPRILYLTVFLQVATAADFVFVNVPSNSSTGAVNQCEFFSFTWQGGQGPYNLSFIDLDFNVVVEAATSIQTQSFHWLVDLPAGSRILTVLTDQEDPGNINPTNDGQFVQFTVQPSADGSCLTRDAQSSSTRVSNVVGGSSDTTNSTTSSDTPTNPSSTASASVGVPSEATTSLSNPSQASPTHSSKNGGLIAGVAILSVISIVQMGTIVILLRRTRTPAVWPLALKRDSSTTDFEQPIQPAGWITFASPPGTSYASNRALSSASRSTSLQDPFASPRTSVVQSPSGSQIFARNSTTSDIQNVDTASRSSAAFTARSTRTIQTPLPPYSVGSSAAGGLVAGRSATPAPTYRSTSSEEGHEVN